MTTLANESLRRGKQYFKDSYNENVLSEMGHFGGLFELNCKDYREPVLVSSIDGVGTKLTFAVDLLKSQIIEYDKNPHWNIGVDLVNHCVNDIVVQGAKPLFFLNYFSTTKLHPSVFENLSAGMSWACKNADCPIVGGEFAQMPGFYPSDLYDIAGSIVGIVEKDKIIDGSKIQGGESIIGIHSSGLHTNGFSLVRDSLLSTHSLHTTFPELDGVPLIDVLLEPHKCYLNIVSEAIKSFEIRGMAHITGGGVEGNTSRIADCSIWWDNWEWPAIFKVIQKYGELDESLMRESFNLGIGLTFFVHKNTADDLIKWLKNCFCLDAFEIGKVQ